MRRAGSTDVLSPRNREILRAVVTDYILSAEPVGSRTVSRKYGVNLSPASVRNAMADLEEAGYLMQPHTSAGRIPTDKGFRVYVDSLLPLRRLSKQEQERIRSQYQAAYDDATELLRETSRILSAVSSLASVVAAPRLDATRVKHIEFVALRERRVLVILVADTGEVQHKVVEVDEDLSQDRLHQMGNYLNGILVGLTLEQARERLLAEMRAEKALYDRLVAQAQALAQRALAREEPWEADVFIEGKLSIAEQPEFANIEKLKALFRAFEEKALLVKLIDKSLRAPGVQVFIGHENEHAEMAGCSVILSQYRRGNQALGVLGVIGPTRMNYSRLIPVVDYTAQLVSQLLET